MWKFGAMMVVGAVLGGCAMAAEPTDTSALAVDNAGSGTTDAGVLADAGPLCCTTLNLCQELAECSSPSWIACQSGTAPQIDAPDAHYAADDNGPIICCLPMSTCGY